MFQLKSNTLDFLLAQDTLVALQALTEYSYRARIRDITYMKVTVEATGEDGHASHEVFISSGNVSKMSIIPVRFISF